MRRSIITGVVVLAMLPLVVVAAKRINSWVSATFNVNETVYLVRASTAKPLVDVQQDQIPSPDVYAIQAVRMYEMGWSQRSQGYVKINGTTTNFGNVRWSTTGEWISDGTSGAAFPGLVVKPDPNDSSTWYYLGGQWTANGPFSHLGFVWHVWLQLPIGPSAIGGDLVLLGYVRQAQVEDWKLAIDYNVLMNAQVLKQCTATIEPFGGDLVLDAVIGPPRPNNTCTP